MFLPELLSMVCSHLPKSDLKSLRLVSHSFEQAAVPFLFDKVFISFEIADLLIAKSLILRFSKHIRTLVFSSVFYSDTDKDQFVEEFIEDFHFGVRELADYDAALAHAEYAFGLYDSTRKLQEEILMSGTCQAHLAFALGRLSNLRKIILTDALSLGANPKVRSTSDSRCPDETCTTDTSLHIDFTAQAGLYVEGPRNPWRTTLLALSATGSRIPDIAMETDDDLGMGLNTRAFELFSSELGDAIVSMQTLVKLRLGLQIDGDRFTLNGEAHYVHPNLPKFLCEAVNLECLALVAEDIGCTSARSDSLLKIVLGNCEFPKLQSLILAFWESTGTELLRLLKHSPKMKQLTLDEHNLSSGSWEVVTNEIRKALPLKYAKFDRLHGGFLALEEGYRDRVGKVEKFFLGEGENPFTKEALDRYAMDKHPRRDWVYDRPSFIERYRMFH